MQPQKPFLLIIDDDLPTLKLYQRELSREYHVVICQDSSQAVHFLETLQLCAVILEPNISNGDGWNLLSAVHLPTLNNRLPVILCSSSDEKKRGLQEGAAVFLTKPVLPGDLLDTLRRVLSIFQS